MIAPFDMDSILQTSGWEEWRAVHRGDPEMLAAGGRQWCASSYWNKHTPQLENWKTVVSDLRSQAVTEEMLLEMAGACKRPLPFPAIPLFEAEQVRDFCGVLYDADAAAALGERLATNGLLLAVDLHNAARYCWDSLSSDVKQGLDFEAWLWMFSESLPALLPNGASVPELARVSTPRRKAAVRRLEEAIQDRGGSNYPAQEVEAVAAALAATSAAPPPSEFAAEDSVVYQRAAKQLFDGVSDSAEWEPMQAAAASRRQDSSSPHPLAEMTRYLRENDFPVALDDLAWKALQETLVRFPRLLEIDGADPGAPLPALQLACSVRSTVTPGLVALGLLPLAGGCRRERLWWTAVAAALRPAPRRGGWGNANDRWKTAIQTVKLGAAGLDEEERTAMSAGLVGENERGIHG
jgi:hypothetical protein